MSSDNCLQRLKMLVCNLRFPILYLLKFDNHNEDEKPFFKVYKRQQLFINLICNTIFIGVSGLLSFFERVEGILNC